MRTPRFGSCRRPLLLLLDLFRRIIRSAVDIDALPGGELIREGLRDLAAGRESAAALLVAVGAPRLRRAGLPIPALTFDDAEHRLYEFLARAHADSAHSRYNALIRRLVSFERACECGV